MAASVQMYPGTRNSIRGVVVSLHDREMLSKFLSEVEKTATFAQIKIEEVCLKGEDEGVFVFLSPKQMPLKNEDGITILNTFMSKYIMNLFPRSYGLSFSYEEVWENKEV